MIKPRIYLDTSVIGGYYDEEFDKATQQLFVRIVNQEFEVYLSEVSELELVLAPARVQEVRGLIPDVSYKHLLLDDDSIELAETYIREKVLGKASLYDAYHIALASANRLDCLISWNFKHIVNYDKIKLFNSINIRFGYPLIDIRTPLAFLKDGTSNDEDI